MKNYVSFVIIFVACFSVLVAQNKQQVNGSVPNNPICDSTTFTYFNKLAKAKVSYEFYLFRNDTLTFPRDRFPPDTLGMEETGMNYHNLVKDFKKRKVYFIECLNYLLTSDKLPFYYRVEFTFYPSYLSNTPACQYLRYIKYIEALLYNLENLPENEYELVCMDTEVKVQKALEWPEFK